MKYAILRTAKIKSVGGIAGSLTHNYRTAPTPNADSDRTHLNEHRGAKSKDEALEMIKAHIPDKRRKDAVLCVEYLISASPEHFVNGEDGSGYFKDAITWLEERHGAENVLVTTIHRDETSPHLVAYIVPLDDTGKLNAKKYLGGRHTLSKMQTDFADRVGKKHGLARGIEGSKATHTTVKQYYDAISKALKKHGIMSPDMLVPKVLEKSLLSTKKETKEQQAARITKIIQDYYDPILLEASNARSDRARASQMAETAQMHLDALKPLQKLTEGLSGAQMDELMAYANGIRESNRLALEEEAQGKAMQAEAERRVNGLEKLSKEHGAKETFGVFALRAIKKEVGDWEKVNWLEVEIESINEMIENGWDINHATKIILENSPSADSISNNKIDTSLINNLQDRDNKNALNLKFDNF